MTTSTARTNAITDLVKVAVASKPQSGWMAILGPILMELIQALIENCAETEDDAVEMLCEPSWFLVRRAESQLLRKLRRNGDIPRGRQRRVAVNQAMEAVVTAANEQPDLVAKAFHEVT